MYTSLINLQGKRLVIIIIAKGVISKNLEIFTSASTIYVSTCELYL